MGDELKTKTDDEKLEQLGGALTVKAESAEEKPDAWEIRMKARAALEERRALAELGEREDATRHRLVYEALLDKQVSIFERGTNLNAVETERVEVHRRAIEQLEDRQAKAFERIADALEKLTPKS